MRTKTMKDPTETKEFNGDKVMTLSRMANMPQSHISMVFSASGASVWDPTSCIGGVSKSVHHWRCMLCIYNFIYICI